MLTCSTCQHWYKEHSFHQVGRCSLLSREQFVGNKDSLVHFSLNTEALEYLYVFTRPEFGCVQHLPLEDRRQLNLFDG